MTERLYYTDSYLSRFTAALHSISQDRKRVYLDRTAFYPTSGGQLHDLGQLGGIPLADVIEEKNGKEKSGEEKNGEIVHILTSPLPQDLTPSTAIDCQIDWSRRWDHMQQHTAQHLVSALWSERFQLETVSVHFGDTLSTIELAAKEITPDQTAAIESAANQICWQSRPVTVSFEDAASAEGLRKASTRSGPLRIVTIGDLDRSACGGTHVHSTAELAPIYLLGFEKIRGRIRLAFTAGARSLKRSRSERELLAQAARELACAPEEVSATANRFRERSLASEKELHRIALERAQAEGAQAYAEAAPDQNGIRRLLLEASVDEKVRAKVQAFTTGSKAVAVAINPENRTVLIACSPDSGYEAGKAVNAHLARGGGAPALAQGTYTEAHQLTQLLAALGFPKDALRRLKTD